MWRNNQQNNDVLSSTLPLEWQKLGICMYVCICVYIYNIYIYIYIYIYVYIYNIYEINLFCITM